MTLSREKARELALAAVNREWGYPIADDELMILDKWVAESDLAWAFSYNTRSSIESGDHLKGLMGNGPILVVKATGATRFMSSSYNREGALAAFAGEQEGKPEPSPGLFLDLEPTKSVPVDFTSLLSFLRRIPAIDPIEPSGTDSNVQGAWLVKFRIDTNHPDAWKTVMDLGYVVNWIALATPLPTIFKPVSSPPDMNGDNPGELLWWLIESWTPSFTPSDLAHALETSLFRYPPSQV
jgi:hypothetical protein